MMEDDNPIAEAINQTLANITDFKTNNEEKKWKVRPLYSTKSKDNYASILYVAEWSDLKTSKTTSLIVKVMPEDINVRVLQNSDKQFHNEINMFQNVIPLLLKYSELKDVSIEPYSLLFPKFYFGDADPENAVIIMENLQLQGYVLTDISLDYTHCKMALEGLARFHALSYAMKHKDKNIFKTKVVDTLKEARHCYQNRNRQNVFMGYTSMHPVNVIMKSEDPKLIEFRKKNGSFLEKLGDVFNNTLDLLVKLNVPKEPLAALCHGDYNRNNIMYNYVDNEPYTLKLLDFQTSRYANPCTDITFLMYLNTTSRLRHEHLDQLLEAYQKTLVSSLVEMTDLCRDELDKIYSIQAIKVDFERHSLLGYVISAMFIHFMLATVEQLIEMQSMKEEEETEIPSEEYLKRCVELGGAEATQRAVDIVQEMALMKNCFDY